jgi:hypothetical protein
MDCTSEKVIKKLKITPFHLVDLPGSLTNWRFSLLSFPVTAFLRHDQKNLRGLPHLHLQNRSHLRSEWCLNDEL